MEGLVVLSVGDVSAASGYSVQQIRDLERIGVITEATRAANGYRRFGAAHVADLRTYRDLALAVGAVEARGAMRAVRSLPLAEAIDAVERLHARLQRERRRALAARRALGAIHGEAATDAPPVATDTMTITELSEALGVRASTLRFWEREGLVAPERARTRSGAARRYPVADAREARIVAALRAAGYRIPDVRQAIQALRDIVQAGGLGPDDVGASEPDDPERSGSRPARDAHVEAADRAPTDAGGAETTHALDDADESIRALDAHVGAREPHGTPPPDDADHARTAPAPDDIDAAIRALDAHAEAIVRRALALLRASAGLAAIIDARGSR